MSSSIRTVAPYRLERDGDVPAKFSLAFGSMLKDEAYSGVLSDAFVVFRHDHGEDGAAPLAEAVRVGTEGYRRKLRPVPLDDATAGFGQLVGAVRHGSAWLDADGDICLVVPHGDRWLETVDRRGAMPDAQAKSSAETYSFDGARRIYLIEGELYARCVEPVYRVVADEDRDVVRVEADLDGDAPDLPAAMAAGLVFRADRRADAVAMADAIAIERGYRVGRHAEIRLLPAARSVADVVKPYLRASAAKVVRALGPGPAATGKALLDMLIEELSGDVSSMSTRYLAGISRTFAAEWERAGLAKSPAMQAALLDLEKAVDRAVREGGADAASDGSREHAGVA